MARGWLSPAGGAQRNEATKHDAIEWIDPANVPSHVGTNAVPDLQAVLAKLAAR